MDATTDRVVGRRVLLLQAGERWAVRATLERLGLGITGAVTDPEAAVGAYRDTDPDVVVADTGFGGGSGAAAVQAVKRLLAIRPRPVIFVSDDDPRDRGTAHDAARAGAFGFLHGPLTDDGLLAAIEVAAARFAELQDCLRERQALALTLETRKLVERAKGIFMKRLGLDESAAHRKLQVESQNRRESMAVVAKRVIDGDELLNA